MKRIVSGIMLTLLLISTLVLTFNVQPVKAIQTIYISADGSIDPPSAPIQRNENLYALTSNIIITSPYSDGIVVLKDNIMIDGAGYTLQCRGGKGIDLSGRTNVTVRNMEIRGFGTGVYLGSSARNNIIQNNMTGGSYGIYTESSLNNTITGNNIRNASWSGIWLRPDSNCNNIIENDIADCWSGIDI